MATAGEPQVFQAAHGCAAFRERRQIPGENTSLLVSGGPGMAGKKSTVNWNSLAIDESAGRTAQEDGHRREIFDYSKFTLKRVFFDPTAARWRNGRRHWRFYPPWGDSIDLDVVGSHSTAIFLVIWRTAALAAPYNEMP